MPEIDARFTDGADLWCRILAHTCHGPAQWAVYYYYHVLWL